MTIMMNFPILNEEQENYEERAQREQTFNMIFNTLYEQRAAQLQMNQQHKKIHKLFHENLKKENGQKQLEREIKRWTSGANFIIQFLMCMHPVHLNCCNHFGFFKCPVDRLLMNCLLPCIDSIQ